MNSAIKLVLSAGVVAALSWSWSPAFAARTGGSTSAGVSSVSCPSAGNCAAVGFINASGVTAFVVNQTQGTWRRGQPVKGMAALPTGGALEADLNWVSCSSPGNCGAGGGYVDHRNSWHPFVVTQTNGTWGRAKEVGLPNPHNGAFSEVDFVSCQATGDCTAVGSYSTMSASLPFVVTEHDGTWGKARELPRNTHLNPSGNVGFDSLSCASVGNCAAGGDYLDAHDNLQAFVATKTNGAWGSPQEVPGIASADKGGRAITESVSCPAAGSCLAVGYYEDSLNETHLFISSQKNGIWGHIQPVSGLLNPATDLFALLPWAWCASPGNCAAIGSYGAADGEHTFSLTEKNGTWGKATKLRLGARPATITSVSCVSIGNCSAGGYFTGPGSLEVFVITETNGTWGKSQEVPGSVRLNQGGNADLNSVSCAAPGDCVAGGFYSPKWPREEPFLVTQNNGVWGNMTKVAGLP